MGPTDHEALDGRDVARILVMQTLPLAAVKASLSSIVDQVEGTHERVMITRNGRPAAVVVSVDDLESLEETLSILSDPAARQRLAAADREVAAGDVVGEDELLDLMQRRGRHA